MWDGNSKTRATKRRAHSLKIASKLINNHISTLAFKYQQSIDHGDYGKSDLNVKKWEHHREKFINSIVAPEIGEGWAKTLYEEICIELDKQAKKAQDNLSKGTCHMTPYDFEDHCASVLRSLGWKASVTKRSGDQGIDVAAQKGKILVVLQCKLYSTAIGNAAVQEAIAGREFMKADFAAVVTNAGYTKSARQLAANTGVFLLHIDDIATLESKIKGIL